MDAASTPVSVLRIGRLRVDYQAPSDHPAIDSIRLRGDDALVARLVPTLAGALERELPREDPSLWFLRRLELDVDVNAQGPSNSLPGTWASQFAGVLAGVVEKGPDSDDVVHFPSRASYMQSFLLDLARGSAWSRWYYDGFQGLRMLSVSAAIRTALCADPETALAALSSIGETLLALVIRALSPADAGLILSSIGLGTQSGDETPDLRSLVVLWQRSEAAGVLDESRQALHLFLLACHDNVSLAGPALREASLELARLAPFFREAAAGRRWRAIAAIAESEGEPVLSLTGPGALPPLGTNRRFGLDELREALGTLEQGPAGTRGAGARARRFTPFGGFFLLLPFLDELPILMATARWAGLERCAPDALLRFTVLLKCFGEASAHALFRDSALRDVLGIPPTVTPDDLAQWQRRLSRRQLRDLRTAMATRELEAAGSAGGSIRPKQTTRAAGNFALPRSLRGPRGADLAVSAVARAVLRSFAVRLPGFARSSAAYLRENFLDFNASVEEEPTRLVVRMGRPPLHLVLSMAGLDRSSFRLSFQGGRTYELFAGE